jgi:hypothetical protein
MADILLQWAGDLTTGENGDLVFVTGVTELEQRIIRRFLTNSQTLVETTGVVAATPDYFFEPTFGGNARAYVDAVVNPEVISSIQTILLAQAQAESDVDPTQTTITVSPITGGLSVAAFVALNTGTFVALPQLEITQ